VDELGAKPGIGGAGALVDDDDDDDDAASFKVDELGDLVDDDDDVGIFSVVYSMPLCSSVSSCLSLFISLFLLIDSLFKACI